MFRFSNQYEIGSETDSIQTTELQSDLNAMLQSEGRPELSKVKLATNYRSVWPTGSEKEDQVRGQVYLQVLWPKEETTRFD